MQKNRFLRAVHVNKLFHLIYIRTIPSLHVEPTQTYKIPMGYSEALYQRRTARQYNEIKKIDRKTNSGR
jgi:hypothetical protein